MHGSGKTGPQSRIGLCPTAVQSVMCALAVASSRVLALGTLRATDLCVSAQSACCRHTLDRLEVMSSIGVQQMVKATSARENTECQH